MRPRVLVLPAVLEQFSGAYYDALQKAGMDVVYPAAPISLSDTAALTQALVGVDAALAGMEPFTRQVLADSPRLKVVARMGVGYDAVDVPAATERKVAVCIAPGTNEISVAEQALALLLGVMRGFPGRDREVRTGVWKRKSLPRLCGKTIGLVGLGRIGRAMVPRAQGLGLRVIASDPYADPVFAEKNQVKLVSFDELLSEADIVSLHAPSTPDTVKLINAQTLARMKPGSVLINTARGGLVDEAALAEALRSGHLMAAGLDAFVVEPLPLDSPLIPLDNVLLAPHMGGLDLQSEVDMSRVAAECIANLYQGRWPEGCVVNESIRAGWKWA